MWLCRVISLYTVTSTGYGAGNLTWKYFQDPGKAWKFFQKLGKISKFLWKFPSFCDLVSNLGNFRKFPRKFQDFWKILGKLFFYQDFREIALGKKNFPKSLWKKFSRGNFPQVFPKLFFFPRKIVKQKNFRGIFFPSLELSISLLFLTVTCGTLWNFFPRSKIFPKPRNLGKTIEIFT